MDATWDGDGLPVEGDTVYVHKGDVLLVDQSSPKLGMIIVEGTLIFVDGADLNVEAESIFVVGGKLIAGTEAAPFLSKLTITLNGDSTGTQTPIFGNKVIGCFNCQLTIHGKTRTPVWTELSETAAVAATVIKVTTAVDWVAG